MRPLVSVLMPVFNAAPFLPHCLASILAQTLENFELVAVDDGSTDGTLAVLEKAARADPRVRPFQAPHEGIVGALNRGWAQCRGGYIARMDADDRMRPGRLAAQLGYLEAHPDCALVGSWVEPYGIGKTLTAGGLRYHDWLNSLTEDAEIKEHFFVDSPIAHSTFFARRALYETLAGYRDCDWAEDYDFLFRAQAVGAGFANVPEVLLERGDHAERLTRTDRRYRRKSMFRAKAHYFARGPWMTGREGVVVVGTGPSGRLVAKALQEEGVTIRGFVDNHPGPPDRTVMGFPAYGSTVLFPAGLLERHGNVLLVLCIGEDTSRKPILARLKQLGLRPGEHFLRFI